MATARTLTDHDLLTMQRRGQAVVEACNVGTSEGVEKAWETRHANGEASGNIHPNLREYAVRESFKKSSAEAAAKSTAKKHNGTENIFLGGKVNATHEQITHALYKNGADSVVKQARETMEKHPDFIKTHPNAPEIWLQGHAEQFKLNPEGLRFYVNKQMGDSSPFKK